MLRDENVIIEDNDEVLIEIILTRFSWLRIISLKIKSVELNKFIINVTYTDFNHKLILTHLTSSDSIHIFMILYHFLQQDLKKDAHIFYKLRSMFQDKHRLTEKYDRHSFFSQKDERLIYVKTLTWIKYQKLNVLCKKKSVSCTYTLS